ncbi:ribosome assembly factor SBDS [Candidatus Woesearchaeota archaeon]|nr:ribosome assembly factor SBDS [Candidatus Woesearchaeota archaeon]
MVDVNKAVIARYKKEGLTFEILVDCDKALEFRQGHNISLDDVIATRNIFKDVKKGEHASENDLKKLFKTEDKTKIIEEIIKHGEIQLTSEHKNKLREEKKKAIINLIHRNSINPQNNLPHPPDRIERALEQSKARIDEFKRPEEQIHEIVSKLSSILPIRFEVWELAVKIPSSFAAQAYRILKEFGDIKKDEWQNDGSLIATLEIPAGMQEDFENKLNKLTHGGVDITILKKK